MSLDHESNSDEKINNCVLQADEAASGSLVVVSKVHYDTTHAHNLIVDKYFKTYNIGPVA